MRLQKREWSGEESNKQGLILHVKCKHVKWNVVGKQSKSVPNMSEMSFLFFVCSK